MEMQRPRGDSTMAVFGGPLVLLVFLLAVPWALRNSPGRLQVGLIRDYKGL